MAINLSRFGPQLKAAYQDILSATTDTNWAVFGYDGKTNDLKVVETGDDGVSGMVDELNNSAIQYAFCHVKDPNTGLNKNVLINWTGEGAPNNRKGACANHVSDVAKFLKGAHVTINARNEDDVDEDEIIDKVSKSSGCNYSFHKEKPMNVTPPTSAVGSVYQKTRADAEIKTSGRQKFWEKTEIDESTRKADNVKAATQEKSRIDDERKRRENIEAEARDKIVSEKTKKIAHEKLVQQKDQQRQHDKEKDEWETCEQQDKMKGRPRINSRGHTDEAASLIAQRGSNPRALWEQKQSQFKPAPPPVVAKTKSQPPPVQQTVVTAPPPPPEREPSPTPVIENIKMPIAQNIMAPPPIQRQPSSSDEDQDQHWAEEPTQELIQPVSEPVTDTYNIPSNTEPSTQEEISSDTQLLDTGVKAIALFDYQAEEDGEITFDPDDVITHIEQIDEGWWRGVGPDGQYGLFPANFVQLL